MNGSINDHPVLSMLLLALEGGKNVSVRYSTLRKASKALQNEWPDKAFRHQVKAWCAGVGANVVFGAPEESMATFEPLNLES